jgi:hypothetical protein
LPLGNFLFNEYTLKTMFYEVLKKITLYFIKLVFILVGLLGVSALALIIRLHQGPLSLEEFKPSLQVQLQKLMPDFEVQLEQPQLVWEGLSEPLKIHLHKITLQSKQKATTKLSIVSLKLTYSFIGLLTEGLTPQGVEIEAPRFFIRERDLLALFLSSQTQPGNTASFLFSKQDLLKTPLSTIKIHKAQLVLHDDEGKTLEYFPSNEFILNKSPKKIQVKASTFWQSRKYAANFEYLLDSKESRISLSLTKISSSLLKFIPQESYKYAPVSLQDLLYFLSASELEFSLAAEGQYQVDKGIKLAQVELNLFDSVFHAPKILSNQLKIHKGSLKAFFKDNLLNIETCELKMADNSMLGAKGKGTWQPDAKRLSLEIAAEAKGVKAEVLKDIWPLDMAPTPRAWVLQNISGAVFSKATCDLKGDVFLVSDKPSIALHDLQGEIEFSNGTVTYMEKMPRVEKINGKAFYNKKEFKIELASGQSVGLKLLKGRIDIGGLDQEDQKLDLKLDILSGLPETIKFISLPPLSFAQKYKIDKLACSGQAATALKLAFPLSTNLSLSDIRANVESHLSNVWLDKPISMIDISVFKGDFILTLNPDKITLQGKSLLNKAPAEILWENTFTEKSLYVTQLKVSTSLTPLWLKEIGADITSIFTGTLPTNLHYLENRQKEGTLKVIADLTPANLNLLGWNKHFKSKGDLEVMIDFQNGKPYLLKKFSATSSEGLKIEGKGVFDSTGKFFKSLVLDSFIAGENQFSGSLIQNNHKKYEINVKGESLNIEPFLKEIGSKEFVLPQLGLNFKAQFDQIKLDPQETLFDNSLSFVSRNGRFLSLDYLSSSRPSKKKENLIYTTITSLPNNTRRFTLQTPSASKLIKALGFPFKIFGGYLQLYAVSDDTLAKSKWEGKLRIKEFSVKDVPALGQILSLAFPTGVIDLFSDKGLSFQQFRTSFTLTPEKIVLSRGHAQGASLGITAQGAVDRARNTLYLSGSVIPAYVLNSLLSKIPLLGELITGGKNEGIFSVSYTVQGSWAAPIVSINPISIFTPGFLRKIFEPSNQEDKEEEDSPFEFEREKASP